MRYIVFDAPPTVSHCLSTAAQQATAAETEDYTFRTRLEDLQRPPSAAVLVLPADEEEEEEEEEEQDDAESWVKSFGPDLTRVGSEGSSSDEESDVDDESLLQDIAVDQEMDAEGDTKLHGFHLPPTQDAATLSQFRSQRPPTQSALLHNVTTLTATQLSDVEPSFGAPPRFLWQPYSLTPFDRLRSLLPTAPTTSRPAKPKVSVLALIVDIHRPRSLGGNKTITEWDLMDPSGQSVKLCIWGTGGEEVSAAVRREDIVWIGGARLSEYTTTLQLSVSHPAGLAQLQGWGLQVCWRTNVVTEEDYQHRFHEGLKGLEGMGQVDEVLKVVEWWRRRWRG